MITRYRFSFTQFQNKCLKLSFIVISAYFIVACTTTKSPTINHSQQFSQGIQTAFSVHPTTANRVAPMILQSAESYNISPHLLAALIRQESSYIANARSSADAVGLTQVRPKFWQQTCSGIFMMNRLILIVAHTFLQNTIKRLVIGSKHLVITMSDQPVIKEASTCAIKHIATPTQ